MNLPSFNPLYPSNVKSDNIRMVHHGLATEKRELENLTRIFNLLDDRFSLDFYLVNADSKYYVEFKELCKGKTRINFRDPVPTKKYHLF